MYTQREQEQEQEQERAERSAYDLKPLAMAEYLLATGDLEGVERMTNDLVVYGAVSLAPPDKFSVICGLFLP